MRKFVALFSLLLLMMTLPVKAQIDTDRMTIIGRNALYFEDYILAIQYFNQIIRAKPYLSEPYYYRAVGKYHLEDFQGAIRDCNMAIERNPFYLDAYNLRGILYQKKEQPRRAIEDFQRGLEIAPRNINLTINLGIAYIRAEEFNKAIDTYTRALDISPTLIGAWLNRGLAHLAIKDTVQAINDFNKAIDTNPYIADGFVNRAMVYYHQGKFGEALADMEKAIALRPDEGSLYMNRGILRYQLDDLQGTLDDFNKVIELEPRNAMAYNNRGILRAEIGDPNRAIEDFSRVLALRGDDMLTAYYRGMLYMEIGEYQKALGDFNFVADAYPDFGPVYYNRAQAKQQLGLTRQAELDYNTAMKLEMARREEIGKREEQELLADGKGKSEEEQESGAKPKRKETREASDRDIRNYNKLAVLDDFGNEETEMITSNTLRGKIQNRNIIIDLEPLYGLSFFPGDTLVHRVRYFIPRVEQFNRHRTFEPALELTNQVLEPDRETSARVFAAIERINARLKAGPSAPRADLYLERGLLYISVLNLNNAIDDFNRVIELEPDNILAWFSRAFARYKMVKIVEDMRSQSPPEAGELDLGGGLTPANNQAASEQRILDYELVLDALEQVAEINPDFSFAWFNMAYIKALMRDFETALDYLTRAIEANPDFAEAYFNRGLIKLFLDETVSGTLDLSKAGELGVFEAYSVIKRYGTSASAQEEEDEPKTE